MDQMKSVGVHTPLMSTLSVRLILIVMMSINCVRSDPLNKFKLGSSFNKALNIMVVVPTMEKKQDYCNSSQPQWERGEEILPGAHIAVSEISELPNLPPLKIIPIVAPHCSVTSKIDDFVGNLTSKMLTKPVAIVGYFCDNLAYFFSKLAGHEHFGVIQISATLPLLPQLNRDYSIMNLYHMLPSPASCARAAVLLCERLGWSRVGVIDRVLYHFSQIREEFLYQARKHNITAVFQMESNSNNLPGQILKELKRSIAKVIVVFLPRSDAVNIMCEAYLEGLIWPDYVWLYVEIDNNSLMIRDTGNCTVNMMMAATESVLFLHVQIWQQGEEHILYPDRNYSTFHRLYCQKLKQSSNAECLQINPYASVLYDSIWAIALAMNRSQSTSLPLQTKRSTMTAIANELSMLSFQGASGLVNFSKKSAALSLSVDIVQVHQSKATRIGTYDPYSDRFSLNMSLLGDIPSDKLNRVYSLYPLYLTAVLLTFLVLSLIFTSITMFLFVHYRKNPEIKATSTLLSLCMFVGCYCLIISSLLHTIASGLVIQNTVLRYAECWGNTFLFTVGMDMVLATVFTKTLRIYRIFYTYGKLSSVWSDKGLFIIILSIVSVKVLLMVIWAAVDINHLIDKRTLSLQQSPPYYEIIQKCYSQNLGLWVALIFGYSGILFFPMITAAILTRRIKGKSSRFKDSKKICILVAVLFILMCTGNALWFFLRAIGANIASKVVYSLGFTLAALFCQLFLFLPKIIPSIRRHADILKPTWVDASLHSSYHEAYAHADHQYHKLM